MHLPMSSRGGGITKYLKKAGESRGVYLVALTLVAAVVNAPSLSQGLYGDDYVHRRFILAHLRGLASHVPWWNMFDSRLPTGAAAWETGALPGPLPWWAAQDYTFRLLRPLSTASQFLDYVLWPDKPWAMHLHNIALVCAIVLTAGALYWHVFQSRLVAWLALLLFALEGALAISASWIASRNTLLTCLFALLTLWSYARGRRVAPLFLLCAHASSEGAVVTWAYLVAFALCLDSRPWSKRLRALVPLAAVTCSWMILSAALGYKVEGSGTYVDPRVDLGLFLRAVAARFPRLLEHQLGMPFEYARALDSTRTNLIYGLGLVYIGVVVIAVIVRAPRSRLVAFFALSYVGALVPQCATDTFERLLPLSAFAANGLLVVVGAEMLDGARRRANALGWAVLSMFAVGTVWLHGVVALSMPRGSAEYGKFYNASIVGATASLPFRPIGSRIIALNFPDYLRSALIELYRNEFAPPGPRRLDFIMISPGAVAFERTSIDELELDAADNALIDPSTLLVRRATDRFHAGQRFSLAGLELEVMRVTSDGRPARVRLKGQGFASPGWLWVTWNAAQQRFVRFVLPPVGASGSLE